MDIIASIRKLLSDEEVVIKRFYERFLNRNANVRELFEGVNMNKQAAMLTNALNAIELNLVGKSLLPRKFLAHLGQQHKSLGVSTDLYPVFRDCFLETLAEYHGTEWDEQLASQWTKATNKAFDAMFKGYDEPTNNK